jgi:hypothetical protein
MSDRGPSGTDVIELKPLPATAVQALYHAATGKTENLSKQLGKNYIVRRRDIDRLYFQILQQLEYYEKVAGPTVTIQVKFKNSEIQQFSSWERFRLFDDSRTEIVSSVVIKFEFVIRLPGTPDPQRYVLTIDIDSKLPVVDDEEDDRASPVLAWFFSSLANLPSLTVSIDFIDYICAKNFSQIVEDWFNSLETSPDFKWLSRVRRSPPISAMAFSRLGNFGAAAFVALYAYLRTENLGNVTQLMYFASVTIVIWTIINVFFSYIGGLFAATLSKSFIPASVLLTVGDERAFKRVQDRTKAIVPKLMRYALGASGALLINIIASFMYAWLTR